MRRFIGEAAIGLGLSAAILAGCGSDEDTSNPDSVEVPTQGISTNMDDAYNLSLDTTWRLTSVTGVGETELIEGSDAAAEASLYRFNFTLGETAVSCLVVTDSETDFPDDGIIDPRLCFIDGDVTRPLVPQP